MNRRMGIIAIVVCVVLAAVPACAKDSVLKTRKDKLSYALGLNMGKNLRNNDIQVNPDMLAQGIKDAIAGGKTLLTEEEAREQIMALQQELREKREGVRKEQGAKNLKEGAAFLAANKKKKGVKTLPDGLQYKILVKGKGRTPKATDTVSVNYKGTLIDGTEFDSSYRRGQPATFRVDGVIKGWTEALQLMHVGAKWQLFIPADLAYGSMGAGPQIGPNAVLIFEVELLSIK